MLFNRAKAKQYLDDRFSIAVYDENGSTLAELLVVMTIISVMAATAVPYVQKGIQREKELELRETLRNIRTAIDAFHNDHKEGIITVSRGDISKNGYPTRMELLIDGVKANSGPGRIKRYLRRFPVHGFSSSQIAPSEQWVFLGYEDPSDAKVWNGVDIYDLRANTERMALDGSAIAEW